MDPAVDQILSAREQLARPRQAVASFVAAVALHAAVVVLVVVLPRLEPPPPPLDYVAVQVVPAQRLGAVAPPRPSRQQAEAPPPKPQPQPPEEPPRASDAPVLPKATPPPPPAARPPKPAKFEKAKPPAPDNRVDPTTHVKTLPPPRELLAQKLAAVAPPAPAAAMPPGAANGAVNGKAPVGSSIAALDNPDFTYDYYIAQLLSRIDQNWIRPPVGNALHAVVSFRIQADGSITELSVRQSSSSDTFDLAALRAVENAAPFPPLPRAYTLSHTTLGVNLSVR